ncbi:MAG: DUF1801 domain-containing protein [Demequinaceae bacterium]|nr:DUF1801 domain-containing protein [Demequinaceae bacterium]
MTDARETKRARTPGGKRSAGFSSEERTAMRERASELKAERGRGRGAMAADGEAAMLAKIAEMPEPDRSLAGRIHEIVRENAPALTPKTWYGMPAYAHDGKVVCFFQGASKFKSRYASFGFNDEARLDDGTMWPTAFALIGLTPEAEARIAALVRKAVGID